MKLVRNILSGAITIVGLMALISVLLDNAGSYIWQQEKYLLTVDNTDLFLTILFYFILLFPVVLSFLILSYLLSDFVLTKAIKKRLTLLFGFGTVVCTLFVASILFYFAVLPAAQQSQFSLFMQNTFSISPLLILAILIFLAYRKTKYIKITDSPR